MNYYNNHNILKTIRSYIIKIKSNLIQDNYFYLNDRINNKWDVVTEERKKRKKN